ncbi:DUF2306 domain-containing protein [Pedobacter sp. MC2016-24]|uniref:DUF2306 domain-containing protein n=1 Tax=Pedobacter sp. MC2016-24 TaxID=2780090 RepID=UPI001D166458|nr:DUF2306 domain-containing protein [Pedobacter sp. MC2016-24]
MMFSEGAKKTALYTWYLLLVYFCYLMLLITLQYIPVNLQAAFLSIKEDVVGRRYYQIAFFSHVYTSMLILLAGMIQFPAQLRKSYPGFHRWFGRFYVAAILFVAGPAGLVMSIHANGGLTAQLAFSILSILWILFTYKAFYAAYTGNIRAHKIWMYRSYALTLSALSLRLWKWLFVVLFEPRPMDVYQVVAWLGWLGNLLIAELLIYYVIQNAKPAPQ